MDIKPTLLRVLTDLYVQKPLHTPDEERHYTELALRLLDEVDANVRIVVAARLAAYPAAPLAVLRRLARDLPEVASEILGHSTALSLPELLTIAHECGPSHAEIISARGEFARKAEPMPAASAAGPADALSLSEIFLAADAAERRLILLNLDYAPMTPAAPFPQMQASDVALRLEQSALTRNVGEVIRIIQTVVAVSRSHAARLVQDPSGEPMIVVAKALGMPAAMLQRIILFLNPAVGQSVQQVYDLAGLYDEITQEAALRLIAIWRDAERPQSAAHQPVYLDGERASARTVATPQGRIERARIPPAHEQWRRGPARS